MLHKIVKVDLFEAQLFFFWDCKPIELSKYVGKRFKGLPPHVHSWCKKRNDNPPEGVCISDPGVSPHVVIWLSKSPQKSPSLLAHEVAHAVFRMMTHWDIELDENTQEISAMLIGYVVKQILK